MAAVVVDPAAVLIVRGSEASLAGAVATVLATVAAVAVYVMVGLT